MRTIAIVGVLLGVLTVAGCRPLSETTPSPVVTAPVAPDPPAAPLQPRNILWGD